MRNHDVNIADAVPLPQFADEWEKNVPYAFSGLTIVIECMAGDTRTKRNDAGFVTEGVMPTAYGFIVGTTDAHGEEIDMYLASHPDRDNPGIYVIDQVNPSNGVFDEHKVMLGFSNADEALFVYTSVFGDGSGEARAGKITSFTTTSFGDWLASNGSSLKPASETLDDDASSQTLSGISRTARSNAEAPTPRDEAGGVIVRLPSLKQGPKINTVVKDGLLHHHFYLYSALEAEVWSNAIDTFVRILDFADNTETVHIHIACPGGSVFLMGRMVSAMGLTRAHVITYAEGSVASAATSTWGHGRERHILPGAYFMQHMSSQLLSDKTSTIAAKANFCVNYIEGQLERLVEIGLFTRDEVTDMSEKSADIYISGTEAVSRVGEVSGDMRNKEVAA